MCPPTTRYTWTAPAGALATPDLRQTHVACLREANGTYVPDLWGGGAAIKKTLYKDCVEKAGFVKTNGEEGVPYSRIKCDTGDCWIPPTCGPDQTCLH